MPRYYLGGGDYRGYRELSKKSKLDSENIVVLYYYISA
jgi:hypothetical protein